LKIRRASCFSIWYVVAKVRCKGKYTRARNFEINHRWCLTKLETWQDSALIEYVEKFHTELNLYV